MRKIVFLVASLLLLSGCSNVKFTMPSETPAFPETESAAPASTPTKEKGDLPAVKIEIPVTNTLVGEGEAQDVEKTFGNFSRVRIYDLSISENMILSRAIRIRLEKGKPRAVIHAQPNIAEDIQCAVSGNMLEIRGGAYRQYQTDALSITLYVQDLTGFEVEAYADVLSPEGVIEGKDFELTLRSATRADMDMQLSRNAELRLSGASDLTLRGTCDTLRMDVSAASQVDTNAFQAKTARVTASGAGNLQLVASEVIDITVSGVANIDTTQQAAKDVRVKLTGAGFVKVWAEKTLDVQISGAGSVRYRGEPAIKESITGIGSVKPL